MDYSPPAFNYLVGKNKKTNLWVIFLVKGYWDNEWNTNDTVNLWPKPLGQPPKQGREQQSFFFKGQISERRGPLRGRLLKHHSDRTALAAPWEGWPGQLASSAHCPATVTSVSGPQTSAVRTTEHAQWAQPTS